MALTIDSISKLSNTKKILILAGILVVVGGLYVKTFILPEQEDLSDRQIQYDKLVKELNESRAITQDLQSYKEQVKKMNEEFSIALKQLPNEKEIPEILKNISSLGKEAQLESNYGGGGDKERNGLGSFPDSEVEEHLRDFRH